MELRTSAGRQSSSVTWQLPRVDLTSWAIERAVSSPSIEDRRVGWVSAEQMREIDRVMVDELGITLVQMMEHAGTNLARLVLATARPSTVTVYAGTGGNGGGGLAAARHLHNLGIDVTVVPSDPHRMTATAAMQLESVQRLAIPISSSPVAADVAVDALVGYSLRRGLDDRLAFLTRSMRRASGAVVSLDVPTGLDATTGEADTSAVVPDATMTLCLPKTGLADRSRVGELFLADIGVPPALASRISGGAAPPFALGPVLRLLRDAGA